MGTQLVNDAHRHLGKMPAFPFYGGPPCNPDMLARGTVAELIADLDSEGIERALVLPNYGVPDASVSFSLQPARRWRPPRPTTGSGAGCGSRRGRRTPSSTRRLWPSPASRGWSRSRPASCSAGAPTIPTASRSWTRSSTPRGTHGLVVHVHTSPGGTSDIDEVGLLVDKYADDVKIHLVHLGGGMSAHIKLIGSRFFDWIEAGKQVYTDTSWAVGFAPRWLAARDRAARHRAGPGAVRQRRAVGRLHAASWPGCGPRPGTARWAS